MTIASLPDALVTAELARHGAADRGRYEVYYLTAPLGNGRAVWLRWTLLVPSDEGAPSCSVWGVFFDQTSAGRFAHRATHDVAVWRPLEGGGVAIGDSMVTPASARGSLSDASGRTLAWDLAWETLADPFPFFSPSLERAASSATFPIAAVPLARARGYVEVDGERIDCDGVPLEQSHLFGGRHAHRWGWLHAAGFDDDPDGFAVLIWARPQRLGGRVPAFSSLTVSVEGAVHRTGGLRGVRWSDLGGDAVRFSARAGGARVEGTVFAGVQRFCGVTYHDPDGAPVYCANTGVADLRLRVDAGGRRIERTSTASCAFERGGRTPMTRIYYPL
jgi:hypothetical protein